MGGMLGLQKRGALRPRRAAAREGTTMILNGPGISYTEPDIGAEFVPPLPEHPREAIVKLCEHCTNRLLHRDELLGYEYWSFAEAATDEQAEVLCKMKMRRPYTLPEMVKLTGMPEADIEKMLDDMSYTGLLEYNWENPERAKQWVLPMLVPGSAEFLNMRVSQLEEHPVYAKFFEQASKGPLSKATPMVPPGGAGIGMHVIPVEKAIDASSTSVPIEHIEHWLDKYEGKYAASTCSCRASRRVMGEGCADDPADWCIAVGDMADYVVETDRGHYVTREEVYDILRQAEDNGFVHQITNIDGENKIFAICNCNVNVCYALRTSQLFNTPNLSRSAYVAKVEKDKCVACGRCVEVCPAGAAKLGQKLCSKKAGGQVPEYPRQELPDATKWDHTKWSPNYRNDNRIETHESGTAPCKTACPAHVAVQGYLKLAAQGRYDEALALIKRENPLPAICGRVCNRRCEDACTRGRVDEAVAIDEVKKFIAQRDLDAATRYVPPVVTPTRAGGFDQKIAIIGAGPAGLSCAFYLAEKGYKPVVFEKNERPGGMLTYGIPSFKLEKDVIEAEVEIIRLMGAEFRYGVEVGRDVTLDELREQGFKAFYVAIGCQGGRLAGIPGEDAEDVTVAVDFLREVNSGKIDALSGRTIVVGGGNVAIDVARNARRLGSEHVEMFCLESEAQMPASEEERREAIEDGAHISCGWGPRRSFWTRPAVCAASPLSAARASTMTRAVLRPSTTRTTCAASMPTVWSCPSASPSCGATCWLAPRWSLAVARVPLPIPRPTRPPNPTSLWVVTSTPAPALPSTPSPPVTRPPCPSIALCSRDPRSLSAATSAATPRLTATTLCSRATTTRAARLRMWIANARRLRPLASMLKLLPRNRCAPRPPAAWAAAPRSSTLTSVSAAACAPPSARLTPSILIATAPSAQRWSNTSKSSRASASTRSSVPSRLNLGRSKKRSKQENGAENGWTASESQAWRGALKEEGIGLLPMPDD